LANFRTACWAITDKNNEILGLAKRGNFIKMGTREKAGIHFSSRQFYCIKKRGKNQKKKIKKIAKK